MGYIVKCLRVSVLEPQCCGVNPSSPISDTVTLGKIHNFSVPQLSQLENSEKYSKYRVSYPLLLLLLQLLFRWSIHLSGLLTSNINLKIAEAS